MTSSSLITSSGRSGHSAKINLRLLLDNLSLTVLQIGEDFLLLDEPVNHPPAQARMVMRVDDSERQWAVSLPEGISASSKRVTIAAA
jgi:hypothetical protein